MTRNLQIALIALMLLLVENGLAEIVPPHWLPDIGLMLIAALGLTASFVSGLWVTVFFGFVMDHLTGAFRGEYELVYLVLFAVTFFANRQINLGGAFRNVVVIGVMTLFQGLGFIAFAALFREQGLLPIALQPEWWIRLFINAGCAPWIVGGFVLLALRRSADASLRSSEGFGPSEASR